MRPEWSCEHCGRGTRSPHYTCDACGGCVCVDCTDARDDEGEPCPYTPAAVDAPFKLSRGKG